VTPDARNGVVPVGSRSSYLPATLATGFPPMAVPGIDLSSAPGMAAALGRATRLGGVVATPMASPRTGTRGLFLVAPAPNLIGEVLRPGYVAVFVPDLGLRAAATGVPAVQVRTAAGSAQAGDGGETSTTSFTAAGRRFTASCLESRPRVLGQSCLGSSWSAASSWSPSAPRSRSTRRDEPERKRSLTASSLCLTRLPIEGDSATMVAIREARPGRVDDYSAIPDDLAPRAAELGMRSAVACPIVVRGRVWGAIAVVRYGDAEPFAADAEERLAQFAELVATAIANADTRDQLTASRARLVTEGDEARRRGVRDLHDGAQQRLVHTIITLKLARQALRENGDEAESLVAEALEEAERSNAELRELAHGLLPATLTRGGLRAGVDAVVERLDLPVETDVPAERLPAEIEASAYFIVAEALTNVVKHAHATG
jgi:Histidine kinase/GAF domain